MTIISTLDTGLIRKLAVVLILKIAVLALLWWGFVREQRVTVDAGSVATQLLQRVQIPATGVKH